MLKVLLTGKTLIVNRNNRAVSVEQYNNPNDLRSTLKDMFDSGAISAHRYNHLIDMLNRQDRAGSVKQ